MPEYFVITDVHGCFDTLQKLIKDMNVQEEDFIISCGDVVDRGPKIKECLDFLMNRKNVINIMGNHDYEFVKYATRGITKDNEGMLDQGLRETIQQIGNQKELYAKFISSWNRYVILPEHPEYVFCHSTYPWQSHELGIFNEFHMWDRWYMHGKKEYDHYNGPIIVHGHTPITRSQQVMFEKNSSNKLIGIDLDGGCCYGGPTARLIGMRVSDRKIFEVKNLD